MKIKTWRVALFAAVLVLCAGANIAIDSRLNQSTGFEIAELRSSLKQSGYAALCMGQLTAEDSGDYFVATLVFPGGLGAVSFGSPDSAMAFARLACVDISPKVGRVKTARTDVIMEASR